MPSILVVDDFVDAATILKQCLEKAGFEVSMAHDGDTALAMAAKMNFDLIVLDLAMPRLDGLEVCREMRRKKTYIPIIVVSARSELSDRIVALEYGADEYLTKPFSFQELLARVNAILRLIRHVSNPQPARKVKIGALTFDREQRSLSKDKAVVKLTAKESAILTILSEQHDTAVSRERLLKEVWGYTHSGYNHTIDTHIHRLRRKVEEDPANPKFLVTVWGGGYKLNTRDEN